MARTPQSKVNMMSETVVNEIISPTRLTMKWNNIAAGMLPDVLLYIQTMIKDWKKMTAR
jgi:hypothetical protein